MYAVFGDQGPDNIISEASYATAQSLGIDPNPATEAFAREYRVAYAPSLDVALADPDIDAVILCTPHALHTAQIAAVVQAGKHVFCEKPLALTRADAEQSEPGPAASRIA